MRHRVIEAVHADAQKRVAEAGQGLERRPVQEGGAAAVRVPPPAGVSEHLSLNG